MKKIVLMSLMSVLYSSLFSQYYFNDIVAHKQSAANYLLLKNEKIRRVKAISIDDDAIINKAFKIEQEISKNADIITIVSTVPNQPTTNLTNTYSNNNLVSSSTNNTKIETNTNYTYTKENWISTITTTTIDTATNSRTSEIHIWEYDNKGLILSMKKIKNSVDTVLISFEYDKYNNIEAEKWTKKGKVIETYYYYYNSKNLLSDVARYNATLNKMIPDYLYDYDDENRITSMTQVFLNGNNYLVWKYTYNANGLKQKEEGYNKKKQFVGKIEYEYTK